MQDWIAAQRSWLVVERLPGYAHDLNPVELIWGNLKSSELANLCPDTIDEAAVYAEDGLQRIGSDQTPGYVSPSSATPASSYDHSVTVLYERP